VTVQQPTAPATRPLRRLRWLVWVAALAVGVGAGVLVEVLRSSPSTPVPTAVAPAAPATTWAAGKRPAPAFSLHDPDGRPVTLAALRGRPVVLTFFDPLCTDFCPLEARVVNEALAGLPVAARPTVIAVSVNPFGNTRATLRHDTKKWRMHGRWRWAIGSTPALKTVWADYGIGVQQTQGHDVVHTEALYLIDARGDERALWLWPFRAPDLLSVLRTTR
jgi:protein SCO1